jgi:hypothetical protein
MKSTPQIADGLVALFREKIQRRILKLTMELHAILYPLRPKSRWRN